ncbi:MAG: RNA polymerase sigma factor [Chitinophagaceae bacterium]
MQFEALYSTYKNMVYNLALHYVQNIQDAEEITQDVFLSVFNKIDTFKHQSDIKTWIYRICINKSLDFIKAKNAKKRIPLLSFFAPNAIAIDNIPSELQHPGISLDKKEELKLLFAAINQLNEKQKTCIILLKIEQKTQSETALIMNMSEKAVESLYQRAKEKLKTILT